MKTKRKYKPAGKGFLKALNNALREEMHKKGLFPPQEEEIDIIECTGDNSVTGCPCVTCIGEAEKLCPIED